MTSTVRVIRALLSKACSFVHAILCYLANSKLLYFSVEPEAGFGLVIVSGRVHSGGGGSTLEGIFIQKVVPNSAADNDGR